MATLVRRNEPMGLALEREPFRIMRDLLGWDPFAEMMPSSGPEVPAFMSRFDVKETKDNYVFKADLPGIDEKDVEITLTANRLTVAGKREAEIVDESERYYASERTYGTFTRTFTLPEGADAEHVEAELRSGVLMLVVAKRPEHQPKRISLKGIGEKVKNVLVGKEKGQA